MTLGSGVSISANGAAKSGFSAGVIRPPSPPVPHSSYSPGNPVRLFLHSTNRTGSILRKRSTVGVWAGGCKCANAVG